MISTKDKELADQFVKELQTKFPMIDLIEMREGWDSPEEVWLMLSYPDDEEQYILARHFASKLSIQYAEQYGTEFAPLSATTESEQQDEPKAS